MSILEIAVAAGDAGPVVKLSGESDVTVADQLRDALKAQIARGARHLTVDLSELRFADSASVNVLLDAYQALKDRGGILELVFPQPAVATALSLLGVDQVLTVRTRAGAAGEGGEDVSLCASIQAVRGQVSRMRGSVPGRGTPGDSASVIALDQAFDADTLRELRKAVLAKAAAAGMPDDGATQVMLAVHELAANAVLHGGGAGRVRMRVTAGELRCEVTDAGPGSIDGDARKGGTDAAPAWPFQRGHGLWLVQNAADHVSVTSGPGGSQVTAVFALPGFSGGH